MAHQSNLKLYNVPFEKDENFILDDALSYLNGLTPVYEVPNYQFVYPQINLTIKVRLSYDGMRGAYARPSANYVLMYTSTDYPSGEGGATQWGTYTLYFIDRIEYIDTDTMRLTLTMDTLNTFVRYCASHLSKNIPFSNRTHIKREHRDRFAKLTSGPYVGIPRIDYLSEGIETSKRKTDDTLIKDTQEKWYLIYRSDNTDENAPISTYLLSEKGYTTSTFNASFNKKTVPQGIYYGIVMQSGSYISYAGTNYAYGSTFGAATNITNALIYRHTDGLMRCTFIGSNGSTEDLAFSLNSGNVTLGAHNCPGAWVLQAKDTVVNNWEADSIDYYYLNGTVKKISNINKTDPRLLKIVEFPYCPYSLNVTGTVITPPTGVYNYGGMLWITENAELTNATVTDISIGKYRVLATTPAQGQNLLSDYLEEPKLLHSDFTTIKVIFDSFAYAIPLENLTFNDVTSVTYNSGFNVFRVDLYASRALSSTYMFHVYNRVNEIIPSNDYEGYIVVKRNNEVPIYNSSYLNYIRSGFNFEVKQKSLQESTQLASTIISAVGMVASFASSMYTGGAGIAAGVGLATSLGVSAMSYGKSISSNKISMASQIASLQAQGASVTGADDLDLLHVYSPLLHVETYETVEHERKGILNKLRLLGYATDRSGQPHTHTRLYYDHLACDAVFDMTDAKFNPDLIADVKEKMSNGVTFIHLVDGAYDFEQQYENWEISLM